MNPMLQQLVQDLMARRKRQRSQMEASASDLRGTAAIDWLNNMRNAAGSGGYQGTSVGGVSTGNSGGGGTQIETKN